MAETVHIDTVTRAAPPRGQKTFPGSAAAIMAVTFVVALLVRLVYLSTFRESPYFAVPIVDAEWHDAWAWEWARGEWSMNGQAFFRAPLYPFWLSLVYRAFGHDLLAARVVQAVVGAGTAAALAGSGWRLGGRAVGLWAGAIASFYGPLVFFDGELLIANLLLALLSWSVFFLLARESSRAHFMAFVLLGLATIARPNAVVLVPLFLWYVGWASRKSGGVRRSLVAGMLFVSLLPAGIVTALNAKAERTFVFIASQGGVNLYAGNNPSATGRTLAIDELAGARGSWADFVRASEEVAEGALGRRLTSREVSDYWSRKAWDWIRSSPVEALRLTIKKASFLANSYELPNDRDVYFERPFPLNLLLWNAGWFSFPWGIVFPLAAVGFVGAFKESKTRRTGGFLAGWLLLYAVSLIPFFVCSRFRLAMVPPVILLAAFSLAGGRRMLRPATVAIGLVAWVIANNGFFDVRLSDPTQETARRGVILIAAGRLDEGREVLRSLVETEKNKATPPSYLGDFAYHLGDAYAREGRNEEAARYFRESLDLGCTTTRMLTTMSRALADMGHFPDAARALRRAIAQRPSDATLWAELGAVLEKSDATDEAMGAYRRSIEISPGHPKAYNGLGLLYQRRADLDSAVAVWRRGVGRVPGSFTLHFNLALVLALQGENQAALQEIDRALAIMPEDSTARALRDEIQKDIGGSTK